MHVIMNIGLNRKCGISTNAPDLHIHILFYKKQAVERNAERMLVSGIPNKLLEGWL